MAMTDIELKQAQEIQYILNQTKHIEPNKPEYWLWSDLAKAHDYFLDQSRLIEFDSFHEKLQKQVFKAIPEFRDIFPKPMHIKTINNPNLNDIDSTYTEDNLDQQITRVGGEFFFQKFYNTEFTQSYFLFPNASFQELVDYASEVNLYRAAKKIRNMTSILVAIVTTKTIKYDKDQTFPQIWHAIWTELFGTNNLDELNQTYNITNAPTTHLRPDQWIYIYYMFQDIVNYIDQHKTLMIEDILEQCRESASFQRNNFKKHTELFPEDLLTKTDFKENVAKIENERKNFWLINYPKSLRQR